MRAETGRKMGSGGGAMAAGLREREWRPYVLAGFIVLATAAAMLAMGRPAICPCGYVLIWDGRVGGGDNSQHLTDWYTFSHVIHGFLFYGLLRLVAPGWSFGWRLVGALVLEVGWEFVENTPWLIERYRGQTVALDYMGDSVDQLGVGYRLHGAGLLARRAAAGGSHAGARRRHGGDDGDGDPRRAPAQRPDARLAGRSGAGVAAGGVRRHLTPGLPSNFFSRWSQQSR
jgi:hypothetical protein